MNLRLLIIPLFLSAFTVAAAELPEIPAEAIAKKKELLFSDDFERAELGKGAATLTLRGYLRGAALVIELSDDGRGIAWDKLRDKARAAGLPTETQSDLVAALERLFVRDREPRAIEEGALLGGGGGMPRRVARPDHAPDGEARHAHEHQGEAAQPQPPGETPRRLRIA